MFLNLRAGGLKVIMVDVDKAYDDLYAHIRDGGGDIE